MNLEKQINTNHEGHEYSVSKPIRLTDENAQVLMEQCLPMLNQFAPESAIRSFFTERTGNEFITLIRGVDKSTGNEKIVGASGFKISEPKARKTINGDEPIRVIYRSFTFISPEVRGGGYYSKIQEEVNQLARQESAEYQVLRTQNGRVWETAQKSFSENETYPNLTSDIPNEVQDIAQFYNKNPDGTNKPMSDLVALTPFYAQLEKVERSCKNPENTKFLEEQFSKAHHFFQEKGLVDKDAKFEGIESVHPYSIMVVSKFNIDKKDKETTL